MANPQFADHEDAISVPRMVETMRGKKVRLVACGKRHSAALVLHAWIADEESPYWYITTTIIVLDRSQPKSLCSMACRAMFTMIRRRHHCRDCGGLFCGACSSKRLPLLDKYGHSPFRYACAIDSDYALGLGASRIRYAFAIVVIGLDKVGNSHRS